jgi:hypothetical protein
MMVTGNISEWTKCSYVTQDPNRNPMKIPKSLKESSVFKKYKPKVNVRMFMSAPPPPVLVTIKDEPAARYLDITPSIKKGHNSK